MDGYELCDELILVSCMLPETKTPLQVLQFLKSNRCLELFPNTAIAIRILLTIPVSVATGERSFSKLKLIKTYLRASMTQERLSALAMLSIEKDVAQTVDYGEIIRDFASVTARKVFLK